MGLTKRGICYKLEESPFTLTVDNYTFHFSSKNHLEKFKEVQKMYRDTLNYTYTRRFGYEVLLNAIADLTLYKRVETRGFCVTLKGGEIVTCPSSLSLSGVNMRQKESRRP